MSGKLLSSIVFESMNIDGLLSAIRNYATPLFQSIIDSRAPAVTVLPPDSAKVGDVPKPEAPVQSDGGFGLPQWVGIGLAVAGIGAGIYGIAQESKYKSLGKDYSSAIDKESAESKRRDAEDVGKMRNIGYVVGSALLAAGITIYFVF